MPEFGDHVPGLKEAVDALGTAAGVAYDNSTSALSSLTVQDAIDELKTLGGGGGGGSGLTYPQVLSASMMQI